MEAGIHFKNTLFLCWAEGLSFPNQLWDFHLPPIIYILFEASRSFRFLISGALIKASKGTNAKGSVVKHVLIMLGHNWLPSWLAATWPFHRELHSCEDTTRRECFKDGRVSYWGLVLCKKKNLRLQSFTSIGVKNNTWNASRCKENTFNIFIVVTTVVIILMFSKK